MVEQGSNTKIGGPRAVCLRGFPEGGTGRSLVDGGRSAVASLQIFSVASWCPYWWRWGLRSPRKWTCSRRFQPLHTVLPLEVPNLGTTVAQTWLEAASNPRSLLLSIWLLVPSLLWMLMKEGVTVILDHASAGDFQPSQDVADLLCLWGIQWGFERRKSEV